MVGSLVPLTDQIIAKDIQNATKQINNELGYVSKMSKFSPLSYLFRVFSSLLALSPTTVF